MNIEHLKYIVEISKEESISKAAKNLHISASAVSQALKELEKKINLKLFMRLKMKTVPTEAGKEVIKQAQKVLHEFEILEQKIAIQRNTNQTNLKIAVVPGIIYNINESIINFKKDFPDIDVHVYEYDPGEILNQLPILQPDIAFLFSDEETLKEDKDLLYEHLATTKYCVLVGEQSSLFNLDEISTQELTSENFVLYNSHAFLEHSRKLVNNIKIHFISNNTDSIRNAIKNGLGVTFGRNVTLKNHPDALTGKIKSIPLKSPAYISDELWTVSLKSKPLNKTSKNFIKYIEACLK
ncbi:LysR family transcriptional regulator [Gottfriedia acidiceleris]|uniref:LysR family transcriptional regulator n=1 Tax=Gottfriedia acidiceleris TaxID=371036 RepID=UPI003D20CA7F